MNARDPVSSSEVVSGSTPASASEAVSYHHLHSHYADLEQQHGAAMLGMWVFLLTEVMFFGGMFASYLAYRVVYFDAWKAGSVHMEFWIGTVNTAVLITSSLFMALGVHAAQKGKRKELVLMLSIVVALGLVFLGLKGLEYYTHWVDHQVPGTSFRYDGPDPQHVELFFVLYFTMTGFHALHVLIGICIIGIIAWLGWKGRFTPEYHNPVENAGLYWHFVDIVWIFLYPLLYLIGHYHR